MMRCGAKRSLTARTGQLRVQVLQSKAAPDMLASRLTGDLVLEIGVKLGRLDHAFLHSNSAKSVAHLYVG